MADAQNGIPVPSSNTSAEAFNRDVIALKTQLKTASESDETHSSEKLDAIIKKAKKSAASDEAEYIFGVFFRSIVEFEATMGSLGSELEKAVSELKKAVSELKKAVSEKKLAEEKAERWREKVQSMKLKMREKDAETLSLLRGEILALLQPSDRRDLRKGIEAVFRDDVAESADVVGDGGGSVLTWWEAVGGALAAVCGGWRESRGGGG